MSELILDKDNFSKEVLEADKPVVVDFWAPWCMPCQMMGHVIQKLSEESDGKYIVGKVNVDEEAELSEQFRIMSIPAIKIFKNGKVVASTIGVTSKEKIYDLIATD